MRVLMSFKIPHETFNTLVREGVAGQRIGQLVEETRPEHIYFTEQDGCRAGLAVYRLEENHEICAIAEPWFLALRAECHFALAMTPDDFAKVDLGELAKKWA